ncbi:transposase [Bradyrhizobium sp. 18BD]
MVRQGPAHGGQCTGSNPDRGKLGSKRHLFVDRRGLPLVVAVTGANRHDCFRGYDRRDTTPACRPRTRLDKLHVDKGYDFARCCHHLRKRGISPRIARRSIEKNDRLSNLGCGTRLAASGKLPIRIERRLDIHLALLTLA